MCTRSRCALCFLSHVISCPTALLVPWGRYALHPLHLGKQHTLISGIWPLELRQIFPCSCHNLCDPVNSSPGKLGSPVRMMQEFSLGSSEARDVILCILIRRPERILSEEAATRWEFRGRYDQLLATYKVEEVTEAAELEQPQTLTDSSGSPRRHPCSRPDFHSLRLSCSVIELRFFAIINTGDQQRQHELPGRKG